MNYRKKTVKFYTLGCKVNQYETQEIREQFLKAGFKEIQDTQPADVYIINTCTVTQKADKESLYYIRLAHRQNPQGFVVVTGCLAQLDREICKEQAGVSLVVPQQQKPQLFKKVLQKIHFKPPYSFSNLQSGISFFYGHSRAFVKVQDGCNNLCSYCRVPLARGRSRSRPLKEIVEEVRRLTDAGYKEIVLTGICLGSYGRDLKPKEDIVSLIENFEKIDGLIRIRLSSIEAQDITAHLIKKIAEKSKLCRHLHIPIQSGDDKILSRMGRSFKRSQYLELFNKLRTAVPEIGLTTDVMVGFPGETEQNFQNTISLLEQMLPLRCHIFGFSARAATKAYCMKDTIEVDKIKARSGYLRQIARQLSHKYLRCCIGFCQEVLLESYTDSSRRYVQGYTDTYINVHLAAKKLKLNDIVKVKLVEVKDGFMQASLL
ncbi:MAG: tRNA (N(6)-L-threonylcarbamoyladenosine(37)-C(2))-methylthiotransferase MtaB [Candidatus Omnitrophica bacterium]|nr:tRNA (N(6)-L-threonylcarbamoyladenosine(37)-C(2))-methylthiotransferase MtaB [Candidatus Omnitrophota bacterium]